MRKSLSSPSPSSDYTNIIPLIEGLRALLEEQQVNITLPSLRIESFTEDLMDILQSLSPGGGFTIAPEAGNGTPAQHHQ